MRNNKDILEKSVETKEFIEQSWSFKGPDLRKRDRFDEPCLKYIRERKIVNAKVEDYANMKNELILVSVSSTTSLTKTE